MGRDYSYNVYLLVDGKDPATILDGEKNPVRVRRVAKGIKTRPGKKVQITRDGKVLPGGAAGLDGVVYGKWQDEESGKTEG